ncbi:methyltransferase domain-containing protein [bacterium]|nr:methyltransferase domain-containing protein [bacterium]
MPTPDSPGPAPVEPFAPDREPPMPATQTFPMPERHRPRPHAAPWWIGYLLINPLRRLLQDPERMLRPHVAPGRTVLEVGPGMGYFTLPIARMVGRHGRVIAIDCQERMLETLARRAATAGLDRTVTTQTCRPHSLGVGRLADAVDLVVAINVVHEAPDPERMIGEMARTLRPGGRLLLSEPRGHVGRDMFLWQYGLCREAGLEACDWPRLTGQRSVVMAKSATADRRG